jgi:hypothetical protein
MLLQLSQYRLATEPRNKVFAIVGQLSQQLNTLEEFEPDKSLLATDYNKSLVQVFSDAIRYAIQELNSLVILQSIRYYCDTESAVSDEFPSWAVRVNIPFNERRDAEDLPPNCFQAANHEGIDPRDAWAEFAGPETLCVTGYYLSQVEKVSDVFTSEV